MKTSELNDEQLIEMAVSRIIERVKKMTGTDLHYGDLVFKIHEGVCRTIEFGVRGRCYNKKPTLVQGGING